MKHHKPFFLIFLGIIFSSSLFAVNFSELNLSIDNRLLFKTEFDSIHAIFLASLENPDAGIRQLTAFPEKLFAVNSGRTIIVLNKFGAAVIPAQGGLPVPIPGYPSFAEGVIPLKGRLQDAAVSKDGKWILYIEPVSPAYGTLYLLSTSGGVKRVITEKIELPSGNFPAKWSPDSMLFVYEKEGRLFYFPILNDLSLAIDERFRLIGDGGITQAEWGQRGDFFFISGNTIYTIRNPQLFTRTIYGDFLSIGNAVKTLPFNFDSNFDSYRAAPDSSSIIVNKNNKGLFLFLLGDNQANTVLPHISIPSGAEDISVLWSSSGHIAALYSSDKKIIVNRFEITGSPGERTVKNLTALNVPESAVCALSPDGTKALFWGEKGLELWDFSAWRLIQKIQVEKVLSCAWIDNSRFIYGNNRHITEINIAGSSVTQKRICLSGADEIGFEGVTRGQPRVLARSGNEWYATDAQNAWLPVNIPQLRQTSLTTDRFRVYLEAQSGGFFKNVPMIRNMQVFSAYSLVSNFTSNKAYSENQSLKIALCFDLYDDDTGLYQVLSALERNNFKATFYLNGEFIRRNPAGVLAITEAGHEAASMFYAPVDFSDSRYRITHDFIAQGLVRNYDEFFAVTGKELVSLWHPPFYRTSDFIIQSAFSALGYRYIPRTLDIQDWLSNEESARLNIRLRSSSEIIELIINNKKNNAVIPVRLGLLKGARNEYLFQRIDVLMDALVRSGIEIVPVSDVSR